MLSRIFFISGLIAFFIVLFMAIVPEFRLFLPALLKGAIITIIVTIFSTLLMYVASFVAAIGRISDSFIIRWVSTVYIELFRGVSLLVILFWLFFVLPEFGITLSPMLTAILGIGLNFGAYGAEIVRGAINSIPTGQWEACTALNISYFRCLISIVLPQAMIVAIPAFSNSMIELLKGTALVSAVTLADLTYASVQQNQLHYRTIEIFGVTLLIYYFFAQIIRFSMEFLESKSTKHLQGRG